VYNVYIGIVDVVKRKEKKYSEISLFDRSSFVGQRKRGYWLYQVYIIVFEGLGEERNNT